MRGKIFLLLLTLALLAGCSMHTRYTLKIDLASFLGDQTQGEIDLGSPTALELYLPDDDDGDPTTPDLDGMLIENPIKADRYLERVAFELEAILTETSGEPLDLNVEVYVAPPDATDLYHGEGTNIGSGTLHLDPNQQGTFAFDLKLVSGDDGFDLIAQGNFRFGIKLAGSAKGFKYELTTLNLALTTRPVGEILNP